MDINQDVDMLPSDGVVLGQGWLERGDMSTKSTQ